MKFLLLILFISSCLSKEIIKDIEIIGLERLTKKELLDDFELKKNSEFSEEKLKNALRELYKKGYFETLEVKTRKEKEHVFLTLIIKENSKIKDIKILGNFRYLNEKKIKKFLKLKKDEFFSEFLIFENIKKLEEFYKKKGFKDIKILHHLQREGKDVYLKIQVEEGKQFFIKNIEYIGELFFPKKTVAKVMAIEKVFDEDKIKKATRELVSFYHKRGFAFAEVSYSYKDEKLTIKINANPLFKIESVNIEGVQQIDSQLVESALLIKKEDYLDFEKIKHTKQNIEAIYSSYGFMPAIKGVICYDFDKKTACVLFSIEEGQKNFIRKIKISGNKKTKDYVIKRELFIKEGDVFDREKIYKSHIRLLQLGWFEDVNIDGKYIGENKHDLIVHVKEKKTNVGMFSLGWHSGVGFVGSIEGRFMNFLGRGYNLSLKAERGEGGYVNYEFYFENPWLFNRKINLGWGIWSLIRPQYGYREREVGSYISLGRRVGVFNEIFGKIRHERSRIYDIRGDAPDEIKEKGEYKTTESVISSGIFRNTTDSFANPSKGYRLLKEFEYATNFFGGDVFYGKSTFDVAFYKKLPLDLILCQHISLSKLFQINDKEIPPTEKFFLGGPLDLRGFEENSIAPLKDGKTVGGGVFFVSNTELRIPFGDELCVCIFYDMGNSYLKNIDLRDLHRSWGVGLRLMKVLPLRIDYAINLTPTNYKRANESSFHFSFYYPPKDWR